MIRTADFKQSGLRSLRLGIAILFHPVDGFEELQKNKHLISAFVLILLTISVRIISIYMTSFHMTSLQPKDANLNLEIIRFVVPLISGVIACYLITAIMDGEAYFSQVLTAMSYALIPYIVFTIPLAAVSLVMSRGELGLYNSINSIIWLWVALLIFIQLKVLNDYTFKKAVGVLLLSIFAFIIFWGTVGLVFALTNHVLQFVREVAVEVRYLLEN
ncbi:Yip1 family protein [Paenibacillus favisporus]|uniref:Yip1 family protein n=1 Tax=Paenibacillus TaxID=44249 RepID=UPI0016430AA7|nr:MULTISPECIES: Yip1 family protein [Paenibacillus]MBJ9989932.1 YIP1 family protein [Paenibacillus sp. S28]MEC0178856.1 Yip1 family protein [Paenibacillus favisporus]